MLLRRPPADEIYTPSHQFPTGAILPLARRQSLLDWAERTTRQSSKTTTTVNFVTTATRWNRCKGWIRKVGSSTSASFTRTIFPALRIGYLVVPKPLLPAFIAAKWLCDRYTAVLEQEVLAEFIGSGAYERHLRRLRRAHAASRRAHRALAA